jgi:hypothetical protein
MRSPCRVPGRDRARQAREGIGVVSARSERWVDEDALQHQLRDLICLAVVGDHVRWVLTDDDELGDWLAEAAPQWRGWAEQVAARLVESQIAPDGRVRSLAKDIPLNWAPDGWLSGKVARPLIAERLTRVVEWARYRHSLAEGADAELLASVATGLEGHLCARETAACTERQRLHHRS